MGAGDPEAIRDFERQSLERNEVTRVIQLVSLVRDDSGIGQFECTVCAESHGLDRTFASK